MTFSLKGKKAKQSQSFLQSMVMTSSLRGKKAEKPWQFPLRLQEPALLAPRGGVGITSHITRGGPAFAEDTLPRGRWYKRSLLYIRSNKPCRTRHPGSPSRGSIAQPSTELTPLTYFVCVLHEAFITNTCVSYSQREARLRARGSQNHPRGSGRPPKQLPRHPRPFEAAACKLPAVQAVHQALRAN